MRMEYSPVLAVMNSVRWSLPPKLTLAVQDSGTAMCAILFPATMHLPVETLRHGAERCQTGLDRARGEPARRTRRLKPLPFSNGSTRASTSSTG